MRPREVEIKVSRLDDGRYTGWVGITRRTGQLGKQIPLESTNITAALAEMNEHARKILREMTGD